MAEFDTQNYTVAEDFELPSKGLIYDKPVNARIKLRSMTTADEMRRLSYSNVPYRTLADIIENCIVGEKPKVHVRDMCIGDYEFLLHKLRVVTYGPEYKMSVGCPNCYNSYEDVINLDELKVNDYNPEEFKKALTIKLPVTGKIVTLQYQTPYILDEIDIQASELQRKNKNSSLDYKYILSTQYAIDTVDGQKLDPVRLEDFINKLPLKDTTFIRNRAEELNKVIGLDTSISTICKKCGKEILTFFRFGPEFFRPSNI